MIHNKSPIGLILIGPSREGLVGLGTQSSGLGIFLPPWIFPGLQVQDPDQVNKSNPGTADTGFSKISIFRP